MFSCDQKRKISDLIQKVIRSTKHPELPEGEIKFKIHIEGKADWSWADIENNGAVTNPGINQFNETVGERMKEE
jgi:hypothetical protein